MLVLVGKKALKLYFFLNLSFIYWKKSHKKAFIALCGWKPLFFYLHI
jgi:hypothetical protein